MIRPISIVALLVLTLRLVESATYAQSDLFATLAAEPSSPYEGQPFTLTLTLYTTGEEFEPDLRLQGLPNEWNLQPFRPLPPMLQPFEGRHYQTLRFQAEAIAPDPGEWMIAPTIEGALVRTEQYLFLARRSRIPIRISVRPFRLVVRKIPVENAPPGYTGLLGVFSLTASLSTNRFQPGDLLTVTWRLRGVGRLDQLPPLGLPPIDGFRVYPPRRLDREPEPTWEQVLIPTNEAVTAIPPLVLIAFNPLTDRFDTLAAGPFPLTLDRDRPLQSIPDSAALLQELLGREPSGILPVFTNLSLRSFGNGEPQAAGRIRTLFASAVQAQEEGRYREAWEIGLRLKQMLSGTPPELSANLGAALEGMGYSGRAILWYLRAFRQCPSHATLRSRLRQIAVQRQLAIPSLACPLGFFSAPMGGRLALAGLAGLLGLLLFPARAHRRAGPFRIALLILAVAIAAWGLGILAWWRWGPARREAVLILDQPVAARLAPASNAYILFRLPPGTVVQKLDSFRDWWRIQIDDTTAWIPAQALESP